MRPIKVCHVITRLEMGGAQFNTLYTVSHLDRARFEPSLVFGPGGILDAKARNLGVASFEADGLDRALNPAKDLRAFLSLKKRLSALRPDIVHTHSSKAGILGRLAARAAGVPLAVHTFHGFGFTPGQGFTARKLFETAEKLCAPLSDALVFVSEANRAEAARKGIGRADRYRIIRSGIELDRYPARIDRAGKLAGLKLITAAGHPAKLEPDAKIVLSIGNLKPQKNPLDMVRIAAAVCAREPKAAFIFTGDGPLRAEVERLVLGMGLEHNFFLPGWREDTAELLALADVYALSSLWEGLPRSLVEALKSGVPCVAYACDGVQDLLRDGKAGFAVPIGRDSAREAAQKICAILSDRNLHARLQEGAISTDLRAFDIDFMVKQQEELYAELFARKMK